jgi:SAM-dependent methyltransferase
LFATNRSFNEAFGQPSIQNYNFENGRRYHAFREGSYMMPNDEKEQERLDLAHHIFKLVLRGRLYRSPLPSQPRQVLDFGTGTGSWAIDFADEHPKSQVLGIDLSPIQPDCAAPNCRFYVDDVESPWTFEAKFDYIHGRGMAGAIKDWDGLLEKVYANLTDDGFVELQEYETVYKSDDDTLSRTPAIVSWQEKLNGAGDRYLYLSRQSGGLVLTDRARINRPLNTAETMKQRMERLGFVDVRDDAYKVCPTIHLLQAGV